MRQGIIFIYHTNPDSLNQQAYKEANDNFYEVRVWEGKTQTIISKNIILVILYISGVDLNDIVINNWKKISRENNVIQTIKTEHTLNNKFNNKHEGWIIGNEDILKTVECNTRNLNINNETNLVNLEQFIKKPTRYAILVGHGREDLVYFNSFAFCGLHSIYGEKQVCHPNHCPYDLPKISIQKIDASAIIILSCSAGRISNGLLPRNCSIGNAVLTSTATSLLAPYKLFTLSSSLIKYTLHLVESGYTIGEIAQKMGAWYEKTTGEQDPFLLFGNSDLILYSPKKNNSLDYDSNVVKDLDLAKKLKEISIGIKTLKVMELMTSELNNIQNLLLEKENSFLKLLHLAKTREIYKHKAIVFQETFNTIQENAENGILEFLAKKSRQSYFWLAEYYSHFSLIKSEVISEANSSSIITNQLFQHPFDPRIKRIRKTCNQRGILIDKPENEEEISIDSLDLVTRPNEFLIKIKLISLKKINILCQPTINGIDTQNINKLKVEATDNKRTINVFPAYLDLNKEIQLTISIDRKLNSGVYYIKIFILKNLNLTILSHPIKCY